MDQRFLRKVKRNDRVARWVITLGGVAIIFSVIFILVLIANVALPLFQDPKAEVFTKFPIVDEEVGADALGLGIDDYLETGFYIDREGTFVFFETRQGRITDRFPTTAAAGNAEAHPVRVEDRGRQRFGILWSDGSLTLEEVVFKPFFDERQDNKRIILHEVRRLEEFSAIEGESPLRSLGRISDEGRKTRVDLLSGGELRIEQKLIIENFLGEVSEESFSEAVTVPAEGGRITSLALSGDGLTLYAGTRAGWLFRWSLQEPGAAERLDAAQAFADGRTITALGLVYGEVSLAVGDDQGLVTTWFPVRTEATDNQKVLHRIHDLSRHESPVVEIQPSLRDKSILSRGADGHLHLDHMTSERHLLNLANHTPVLRYAFSQRSDSVIGLTAEGQGIVWKLHNPHPEISWKTLFGKVWYEGYDQPEMVWQSSSASDDFEPKLGLTPLIFGTLKGTFYAMLFALPLALFGAIYTSQFCRPKLRELIKPAVEVMAAIPTVIIGFLAALWLAPLIEASLGSLFLSLIFIPAGLMIAVISWQSLRKYEPLKRVERGFEFLAIVPILLMAVACAAVLGPLAETLLFDGDLKLWLFQEWGTRYDPRNCIIIAFGMGFAVIPIIFTIAEDSLSNIPPSLKAASLACGASRWQTVWRVILPSASPGIFAGTMIGFGRAVGETMIVLMATGNTPILDWSIFNGMRPLSANIAVEIPEAPHGGTLYRVLFLSAVILFLMTFVVNTVAEIVRQRLRKKYGRF